MDEIITKAMNDLTNILNAIYSNGSSNMNNANLWKALLNELNTGKDQHLFVSFIQTSLSTQPENALSLDLLDYVVDYGGYHVISQISSKDFLRALASLALPGSPAPVSIQQKILYLIAKWGNRFNANVDNPFPTFLDLYNYLLSQGVSFPLNDHSTYQQHTDPNYVAFTQMNTTEDQSKLSKVTSIANLWIKKLTEVNQLIDQGNIGLNRERLRTEMEGLHQWKEKVNKMIGEYFEESNIREVFINLKRDIEQTCYRYELLCRNEQLVPFVSSFKKLHESNTANNNLYSYYSFEQFDKGDLNAKKYPLNNPKLDKEHIKKEFKDLGEKIKQPFDKMGKDMNHKFGKIKDQWDSYDPNMSQNKENKHGYIDTTGHLHEHKPFLVKMKKGFSNIQKTFENIGKKK